MVLPKGIVLDYGGVLDRPGAPYFVKAMWKRGVSLVVLSDVPTDHVKADLVRLNFELSWFCRILGVDLHDDWEANKDSEATWRGAFRALQVGEADQVWIIEDNPSWAAIGCNARPNTSGFVFGRKADVDRVTWCRHLIRLEFFAEIFPRT